MAYDELKLDNQLCFPLYAASRMVTRAYRPYLEPLGLTYPQYLVLMVLWEEEAITLGKISERLLLNTNTLTPLLKRMENQGLLIRRRKDDDGRQVLHDLTTKGRALEEEARSIPKALFEQAAGGELSAGELHQLQSLLMKLLNRLHGAEL